MNKKERTEKAMREFINEVEQNPETVSVGVADNCDFCIIHLRDLVPLQYVENGCRGCPFANRRGASGCTLFDAYKELRFEKPEDHILIRVLKNLKAIQKVLMAVPAKRFTREEWEYFIELEPLMFII